MARLTGHKSPRAPDPERERKRLAWLAREARDSADLEAVRGRLHVGDLDGAGKLAAAFHVRKGTPGMGFSWKDGHPGLEPTRVMLGLDHSLLEGDPAMIRGFAVELALEVLVGLPGRADAVCAGLPPAVDAFLEQPPCSRFVATFKSEPLQLYAQTMRLMGYVSTSLASIYRARAAARAIGRTFRAWPSTSGEPCTICDPQAALGPMELEQLPSVPPH